jgi:hypothetical protein
MFRTLGIAAAAAVAFAAAPASAATVAYGAINPGGNVTLTPAGPGAVSSAISFDVSGTAGSFTATFNFVNPFNPAAATGSASFDFDPDVVQFTSGTFGPGSTFSLASPGTGSAITVQFVNMAAGPQTLTLMGNFNPNGLPAGGNAFARVGGSLNLTGGAVPEPATWALFILGFGAMGHAMRRRSSKVRIAKASLNFA